MCHRIASRSDAETSRSSTARGWPTSSTWPSYRVGPAFFTNLFVRGLSAPMILVWTLPSFWDAVLVFRSIGCALSPGEAVGTTESIRATVPLITAFTASRPCA
jgi:hypothetical protein